MRIFRSWPKYGWVALLASGLGGVGSLRAVQSTTYGWAGGSGVWDTTSAVWKSGTGGFTKVFVPGPNNRAQFFLTAGTVTLDADIATATLETTQSGYTFDLNGHSLSLTSFWSLPTGGTETFDFASGASQLSVAGVDSFVDDMAAEIDITNYQVGSSVFRLGTDGTTYANLSKIVFVGYTDSGAAQLDSNGYVTPVGVLAAVPEPAAAAGCLGLLALGVAGLRAFRRRTSVSAPAIRQSKG